MQQYFLLKIVKLPGEDGERVPSLGAMVRPDETVASLKAKIAQSYPWSVQRQILFFGLVELQDDKTLEFYGIPLNNQPLQLLLRPAPAPTQPKPRLAFPIAPAPLAALAAAVAARANHTRPTSALVEPPHHLVTCSACRIPIVGVRYKCANCPNFDFCEGCEERNTHPATHIFLKCRYLLQPLPVNEILLPRLLVAAASARPDAAWHRAGPNPNTDANVLPPLASIPGLVPALTPAAGRASASSALAPAPGPAPARSTGPALSLPARCRLDTYRHMLQVGVPDQAVAGKVRVMEGALATTFLRELFPAGLGLPAPSRPNPTTLPSAPVNHLASRTGIYGEMLRVGVPLAAVLQKVRVSEGILAESIVRDLQRPQPLPVPVPVPVPFFVPVPPPQPPTARQPKARSLLEAVVQAQAQAQARAQAQAQAQAQVAQAQALAAQAEAEANRAAPRRAVFPSEYAVLCEMGFSPVKAARILRNHNGQLDAALAELLGQ